MNQVTLRYFAAARAAAGVLDEVVEVAAGATIEDLLFYLEQRHGDDLGRVLASSSLLVDEVVVSDRLSVVTHGSTVDVLPPFAGG